MTFLEGLWSALYTAECERAYANFVAAGLSVSDMTDADLQAVADNAAAFASEMIQRSPGANLAALQAIIAALK